MSYNKEFFIEYKNYLQEPKVRNTHDWMFRIFHDTFPKWKYPLNIIDFGCGQCCEYLDYGRHSRYVGVDMNPPDRPGPFVKCDYTKQISTGNWGMLPYGFVSLFSTECCLSPVDKYAFYSKIFRETEVEAALVSGFYYRDRIKQEQVEETGEIVSYQTIEDQRDYQCPEFIEYRTFVNVPSKMFGPDVVEVWKLLFRKPSYVN